MLFEWSLSVAISTGLRTAGLLSNEQEEGTGGGGVAAVIGQAPSPSPPPVPVITGIAAWDSALLLEYHRRKKRAEKTAEAVAAAAAAAAAEAAAAAGEDEEPAAGWSNDGIASAPVSTGEAHPGGCVDHGNGAREIGGGGTEGSPVKALLLPTASTAATAVAAATADSADGPHAAAPSCDKIGDGDESTASESTDETSIGSRLTGSSNCEEEDLDSSQSGQDSRTANREQEGESRQDLPDVDDQGPVDNVPGAGSERGSQGSQGEYSEQLAQELQQLNMETLSEGEKSTHEKSERPTMTGGPDGSRPRHHQRKRKLSGFEGALELATRCLRKDGFNAKAYNLRAELETRLGRRDRAIADYRAAASLEVGDPRPRINMVRRLRSVRIFLGYFRIAYWLKLIPRGQTR